MSNAPACWLPSLFPGAQGRISLQALHAFTQADVLAHLPPASTGLNKSRLPASVWFYFIYLFICSKLGDLGLAVGTASYSI